MEVISLIFYQGPSVLDGQPIVAILTGYKHKGSQNAKTGRMLQTWILRSDVHPAVAAKDGSDYSICGDCKFRADPATSRKRRCYVRVHQAPAAIYRAYKANRYQVYSASSIQEGTLPASGVRLRMGSYGDPAAVPMGAWQELLGRVQHRTGYTHQWASPVAQWLAPYVMASCDSVAEYVLAKSMGWNAFVAHNHQDQKTRELLKAHGVKPCPSSAEWKAEGKPVVPCSTCLKCDGTKGDRMIAGHGVSKNRIGLKVLV